jgi:hypothetical protein
MHQNGDKRGALLRWAMEREGALLVPVQPPIMDRVQLFLLRVLCAEYPSLRCSNANFLGMAVYGPCAIDRLRSTV